MAITRSAKGSSPCCQRSEGEAKPASHLPSPLALRQSTEKPSFSLSDIREAIPKHCWERSYVTSLSYLFVDIAISAVFYYAAWKLDTSLSHLPFWTARAPLWLLYWCAQGCIQTGLWVIAHECGHGGFSDSTLLNDTVGFLVHSFLLVPYWSWKYSHAKHHARTGDMTGDEVFVPKTRSEVSEQPLLYSAVGRCLTIVIMLTLGWPAHLLFHATGQKYPMFTTHFLPNSDLFKPSQKPFVLLSDVGMVAMIALIAYTSNVMGFGWMMRFYGVPYLIVNMFLVLITELQHTDPWLPHYTKSEWKWLRGALATVDRDYGFLNTVFHHIGDTHVCHHIFSSMPHYHAQEATEAIKPLLGEYYKMDRTPIVKALWRTFRECHYVPDGEGVLFFESFLDTQKKADLKIKSSE